METLDRAAWLQGLPPGQGCPADDGLGIFKLWRGGMTVAGRGFRETGPTQTTDLETGRKLGKEERPAGTQVLGLCRHWARVPVGAL